MKVVSEFDYLRQKGTPLFHLYQLSYSHPSFKVRRAAVYCLIKGCCHVDSREEEIITAFGTIGLSRWYSTERNCWVYLCPGAKLCYSNEDFWPQEEERNE